MQKALFGGEEAIGEEIGDLERWCARRGLEWIVGVDEAGRGPLAGPVHAAAVAVRIDALEAPWVALLDDSKELEEGEREEAFEAIGVEAPASAIASASAETIDHTDILQAAREAMREAALEVCEQLESSVDRLFVDGDKRIDVPFSQSTLVGGDGRSYAIAAASILAKVSRDRRMEEYDRQWPAYNFASNKGYPTAAHREAIAEHGPCSIHRRSFSGVEPTDG